MPEVSINLGEHVTWHFVGPDAMHSVTGVSPNATSLDSDPQTRQPRHQLGDTYRVEFDQPGLYEFECKLHTAVGGTVAVSPNAGDPRTEPDRVPPIRADLRAPAYGGVRLTSKRVGVRGTGLRIALDEAARLEAEYYRFQADGRRKYVGYAGWAGHVGFNDLRFANRRRHFRGRPGRYVAILSATDRAANRSRERRIIFTIEPPSG